MAIVRACLLATFTLAASAAAAQPPGCDRPYRPHIPAGAAAEHWQMEAAKKELDSYLEDIRAYRDCLRAAHDAAGEEAEEVIGRWQEAVAAYKDGR